MGVSGALFTVNTGTKGDIEEQVYGADMAYSYRGIEFLAEYFGLLNSYAASSAFYAQLAYSLKEDITPYARYEALARMRNEDGTILLPGSFIETAEIFGLVGAIDRSIMEKTLQLHADIHRRGQELSFSINLSGKDLEDRELLAFLQSLISEKGVDPDHLIFEITETAAIHDMARALRFIAGLKSLGCLFSLDDFGVGFTSFVYLKEMQVDYIKIDGSFIKNLPRNQNDRLIVKAITDVARGMGIRTIAEFVSEEQTIDLLKQLRVDYAQGYAVGKPAPWSEIKF